MKLVSLLASIGGNLSLLLGISLFSLFEAIELLMEINFIFFKWSKIESIIYHITSLIIFYSVWGDLDSVEVQNIFWFSTGDGSRPKKNIRSRTKHGRDRN